MRYVKLVTGILSFITFTIIISIIRITNINIYFGWNNPKSFLLFIPIVLLSIIHTILGFIIEKRINNKRLIVVVFCILLVPFCIFLFNIFGTQNSKSNIAILTGALFLSIIQYLISIPK